MNKFHRFLSVGAIACLGLSLGGCSFSNNNHHNYSSNNYSYSSQPEMLERRTEVKTFSENFYDSHSDKEASEALDKKVNNYLEGIKDLQNYNISIKTSGISDDGDHNGDQVLVDTIVLSRKAR